MRQTLFDKCGGLSTVSRIVIALYDRLLPDDVGPYFNDVGHAAVVGPLMGGLVHRPAVADDRSGEAIRGWVFRPPFTTGRQA